MPDLQPAGTLELFIQQLISEVVAEMDLSKLPNAKLAYTPQEVAELAGFSSGLAVEREALAGRLIGTKVRNKWRFTPERIREYLRENEVVM